MKTVKARLATVSEENTKIKAKLTDLEKRSCRNNLPENIEGAQPLLDSAPELERAHRMLAPKPGPGEKPRAIVMRYHRFQTRELVVREARKLRGKLKYKGSPIHIFEDYSPEIVEQ